MVGRGTCAVVICHGMSEYKFASSIKSKLRLNIKLLARDKGAISIQIDGLPDYFHNKILRNKRALVRQYPGILQDKQRLVDFKIFTLMDVDDCKDISARKNYLAGHISGLGQYDLKPYLHPIYCRENLEDALTDIDFAYVAATDRQKRHYLKVFDPVSGVIADEATIVGLRDRFRHSNRSNFDEFLDYCLAHQFRL